MSSVRLRLAFALLAIVALTGCGVGEIEGPSDGPLPASSAPSLSASSPPACSSFVYPTLRTTRISIAEGACLSFGRYSDITAVITGVDVAGMALFESIDELTYRGVLAGSTVFSVATKREICTATATCQVPNPVKRLTVTVTKAG